MQNMLSIKEVSENWGISTRRILKLCSEGRIPGAVKVGKWQIPADAIKPVDKRVRTGEFIKDKSDECLSLPIGVSDYRKAVKEYYYVDKTMLIKEFLDEKAQVSLFTRPRRFGKTLNMDMLKTFFEIGTEDNSVYFKDKKIWKCGQKYRDYLGKYPVIFISFKDIKHKNWEDSLRNIAAVLSGEFLRHKEIYDSVKVNEFDKEYYRSVAAQKADEVELGQSLLILSRMLHEHHGTAPVIIIDEYDTPIQQGYMADFYEQAVAFMRNFFSGGLKDNQHLSYGFMTGILRVAKESIFSGLNNLKINSIMDQKYSEYFGFTSEEVKMLAAYYKADDKYAEICEWYDGYRFGNNDIFNPWSVSYYFTDGCEPRAFWLATGSNDIIGEVLKIVDTDTYNSLQILLQGHSVTAYVDTNVIYPQIKDNPSSVFSFLLMTGYLKTIKTEMAFGGDYMCELAVPNREISFVYNKEILERMSYMMPHGVTMEVQVALYSGDSEKLKVAMEKLLLKSVSYYDVAKESFYHGFVLGLCAVMDNRYEVTSNREAGDGRFDICLKPRKSCLPGILIELKAADKQDGLKELAKEAVKQIDNKRYGAVFEEAGVESVLKYGVAFFGKYVEVELITLK